MGGGGVSRTIPRKWPKSDESKKSLVLFFLFTLWTAARAIIRAVERSRCVRGAADGVRGAADAVRGTTDAVRGAAGDLN